MSADAPRFPRTAELFQDAAKLSGAVSGRDGKATTTDIARNIQTSYDASPLPPSIKAKGEITTLLDLTSRDIQDDYLFPLTSDTTWFTRDTERRVLPFTPLVQEIPFRGPAAFGQRFSFDLGSLAVGDLLFGAAVQIRLDHWLDAQTQLLLAAGRIRYAAPGTGWEYANSLGSALIARAELEIDGDTVEVIDGDFINVFSTLFPDFNTQFGVAADHLGRRPTTRLLAQTQPRLWPTEEGILHCVLPFFFGRQRRAQEALPMIAIREGLTRLHVTLRPFEECVRQLRGWRDSCEATPLGQTFQFVPAVGGAEARTALASAVPPPFKSLQLVTYGAILDGPYRQKMLREPFEMMHRVVQTFSFDEPLKYAVAKRDGADGGGIRIQLPLEANGPLEEILWFVRRKGAADNNAWTNYTSVLEQEWSSVNGTLTGGQAQAAAKPLLLSAALQLNGITVCEAEEQYFRQLIASNHRGGFAAYGSYIYGYPFARNPGEHQPSGTANASKMNSLRLSLTVRPPGGELDAAWEVKVFCIGLNWMRYEHGLANAVFAD
jgi:hypothetical protein